MFENRIRGFFHSPSPAPIAAETSTAFVACPAPLYATFSPAQHAFVAEVYRRAQELARERLRQRVRSRTPEFSRN